jgi:tripartite ATP-independent transporter DctP family solute receptor
MRTRVFLGWIALPVALIAWGLWRGATSPQEKATVLRLAHVLNEQHPVHRGMAVFAEETQRLSGGRLRIDLYADGKLGSERELLELVQIGSLAATKVSAGQLEAFSPQYSLFGLPYLFDDRAHFWRFAQSDDGARLLDAPQSARLQGLTFYDAGSRSFYFGRDVDVRLDHPDDLRGLAVRVMPSRTAIAMVEALGAKPVPIPFGELYSALDTGTVDGAENNPPSLYTSRQYEVSSSYSLNEHAILPDVLVIGTRTWERLSEQERGWLREAARRSAIAQRRMWLDSESESLREMRKAGLTIVTGIDRAAFRERVRPVYARPEFRLPEMLALIAAVDTQRRPPEQASAQQTSAQQASEPAP